MVAPLQYWWDLDDDRAKDEADSNIGYGSDGAGWTAEKHADVWSAATEWRGSTRWDPFDASGGGTIRATVRVDGALLCLAEVFSTWPQALYAVSCNEFYARKDGTVIEFYDIIDSDVTINEEDWNFNYGADDPPSNQPDFRGVLTHEIGHGARLEHVNPCGNPEYTMCSPNSGNLAQGLGVLTKKLRTLTTHDIDSANFLWPT
jgi:hypothetical protein